MKIVTFLRKNTVTPKNFVFFLQEYTSIIHISSIIVARRPVYVRLALWFLRHPAWMEGHTGGSRLTPTVHPCWLRSGGCGWPMKSKSPIHHRNTRNPYMVAEHEFRTTTQTPTSQPESRRRDSQPHSSRAGHHQSARFSRDAGECHVGRTLW